MLTDEATGKEEQLRRDMMRFSRWLSRLNFTPGTSGNLSVRLAGERLLVTPTGMSKGLIRASDMVVVDMGGRLIRGTRNVTSEIGMHLAIYERRTDVHAVVHAHPVTATAFACSGRALDELLCQEAVITLGRVPLACYATTGTDEVAESLLPHVDTHDAVLLENHGAVTYGTTLQDAFFKMETLEHIAQIALVAHQVRSAQPLRPEQVKRLQFAKLKYQHNATVLSGPS